MAMDWNHAQIEERLSDYLERATTAEESAAIAAHLASCPPCNQMAGQVRALLAGMQAMEMVAEPPQLAAKIIDATLGPRVPSAGWTRGFGWLSWLWQPRVVMGALTVAATLLIVMNTVGSRPNHFRRWAWSPMDAVRGVNRQAHLTYARSAKYVNDLRVVYEIQTKLQPDNPPQAEPLPDSRPETQPKDGVPQEKSQADPHRNRSQIRSGSLYAMLMPMTTSMATTMAMSMPMLPSATPNRSAR